VIGAGALGGQQQEDQIDRLVVDRVEVDRLLQPREEPVQLLQPRELARACFLLVTRRLGTTVFTPISSVMSMNAFPDYPGLRGSRRQVCSRLPRGSTQPIVPSGRR
jgi:hypothetical protein